MRYDRITDELRQRVQAQAAAPLDPTKGSWGTATPVARLNRLRDWHAWQCVCWTLDESPTRAREHAQLSRAAQELAVDELVRSIKEAPSDPPERHP